MSALIPLFCQVHDKPKQRYICHITDATLHYVSVNFSTNYTNFRPVRSPAFCKFTNNALVNLQNPSLLVYL